MYDHKCYCILYTALVILFSLAFVFGCDETNNSCFDDWIYFYDMDDYEAGLYKMGLDGGRLQKVHQ